MKVFVLIDRSGSMVNHWAEVVGGVNQWIDGLAEDTKVSAYAFDTVFDEVAVKQKPKKAAATLGARLLGTGADTISPRGMTALYDAIGRMATIVKEQVKEGKKAQIAIITDGLENASKESGKSAAAGIVDGWKALGYDVVYLGANFKDFSDAESIGVSLGQTMSFSTTHDSNVASTAAAMSRRSASYAASGVVTDFTDEERKQAGEA